MSAWIYQLLPVVGVAGFVAAGAALVWRPAVAGTRQVWMAPAAMSCLFLLWSAYAALTEGPLGFWPEHTRNAWGNQIWLDLLLSISVAFALLAPGARAVGMRVAPWFVLILCTGSVGLLAMTARYLFLRERSPAPDPAVS